MCVYSLLSTGRCRSHERTQRAVDDERGGGVGGETLFPLDYQGSSLEGDLGLLKEEEGFPGLERRRAF